MALIDDAIAYANIEETKEKVQPLFDAAEAYITNAIEQKDLAINEKNPLFCLAVKMLVSHWYDNRQPVGQSGMNTIPFGLEGIITQLKHSPPAV